MGPPTRNYKNFLSMKGFDMEANAMVQMALLAVLPLVMQGLKNILWVENNKAWVCPLLCIGISTAAAYFMHLPQWLMVGIITGAACNKVYDWGKDLKNATMILLILLLPMLVLAGCNGSITTQKQQCLAAEKTFTSIVDELTLAKQLGMFTPKQQQEISIVIHEGQACLNQWHASLKDPNVIATDWPLCVNSAMIKLLTYETQVKGDAK
jgi:predicted small secreted protein